MTINQDFTMDNVKAAYSYAVSWVAAHPNATVNLILGSAVGAILKMIF